MIYEVKSVRVQGGVADDQLILNEALIDRWEPFAVTGVRGDYVYHLRRLTYKD